MDLLQTNTSLKALGEIAQIIATSLTIIGIPTSGYFKRLFRNKPQKRKSFMKLAKRKDLFHLNEKVEKIMADEYEGIVINNIRGFDITPYYNDLLLASEISKQYTNPEIKFARRYFDFSNHKFNIVFEKIDKFMCRFYWLWAGSLIIAGFLSLILLDSHINIFRYLGLVSLYLLMILLGFYMTHHFIAPFVLAKKMKKELNLG